MARPRTRARGQTEFALWLWGLLDTGRATKAQVVVWTGATDKTVEEWLAGKGPLLPTPTRLAIRHGLGELIGVTLPGPPPGPPKPRPVRPPRTPRERKIGTEIAWRVILLERDHPEQARAVVALIRAMRALTPAEGDVLRHLDFLVVQGGAQ